MAEIVNLRMARKARDRQKADKLASENRAKFGRTKAEKARDRAGAERIERSTDGARREAPKGPDDGTV